MHELLGAKSVRRHELRSTSSSSRSSPDPALIDQLQRSCSSNFDFVTFREVVCGKERSTEVEGDEVDIRLFATPAGAQPTTHRVRICSPEAVLSKPGLLIPRPHHYYFTGAVTSAEHRQLQAAAVDGATVMGMSEHAWPGCALSWKVQRISLEGWQNTTLTKQLPTLVAVSEVNSKRRRKSKKTRIAIRKKLQTATDQQRAEAKMSHEKEQLLREKKTRRNREKKVKRKAREQAKKLTQAT